MRVTENGGTFLAIGVQELPQPNDKSQGREASLRRATFEIRLISKRRQTHVSEIGSGSAQQERLRENHRVSSIRQSLGRVAVQGAIIGRWQRRH